MIFGFEQDFEGSLRCIPMVVRFKLDHAGIKLSLRQWAHFTTPDRAELVRRPCATEAEIAGWRDHLVGLIADRAGETAKPVAVDDAPAWRLAARVPDDVADKARSVGLAAPAVSQWAALSPLQRFTLLKLTRADHENANFGPAMREFGLAPEARVLAS